MLDAGADPGHTAIISHFFSEVVDGPPLIRWRQTDHTSFRYEMCGLPTEIQCREIRMRMRRNVNRVHGAIGAFQFFGSYVALFRNLLGMSCAASIGEIKNVRNELGAHLPLLSEGKGR
jgi:hypothetical protein